MLPGKKYQPEDYVWVAWARKWFIIVPTIVIASATFVYSYFLPNRYRSTAVVLVIGQQVPKDMVQSTITDTVAERLRAIQQQILSRTRLERIIDEFGLYAKERKTRIMEDIVEQMRTRDLGINIAAQGRGADASSFNVSFTAEQPRTAMLVAERLASLFVQENLVNRGNQAETTSQFLQGQLEETRRKLQEHDDKLAAFRLRHSGKLPSQTTSNLAMVSTTQAQIEANSASAGQERDRISVLETLLAEAGADPATGGPPPAPSVFAQQLAAARQNLKNAQLKLTDDHPDIRTAKRVIAELEAKAEEEALAAPLSSEAGVATAANANPRVSEWRAEVMELKAGLERRRQEDARLRKHLASYFVRVEATPGVESELNDLLRDYDTTRDYYESLLKRSDEAKLSESLERRQIGEQFKVIDSARLPERPISPNRRQLNLFGLGRWSRARARARRPSRVPRYHVQDRQRRAHEPVAARARRDSGDDQRQGAPAAPAPAAARRGGGVVDDRTHGRRSDRLAASPHPGLDRLMYRAFYGLRERPFDLTPNPAYLVLTTAHREALSHLEYGIASRKGMTLLLGDAGTGKTTVIRTALERQPARVHCVHLQNPALTREEFMQMLAVRFGLGPDAAQSKTTLLLQLESLLKRRRETGESTVLVVDEAQSAPLDMLEEIRLLANIETEDEKLLTVILAGQPELANRLNEQSLRQLKQRIALRCELRPLTTAETPAYIAGRIRAAGGVAAHLFTREAVMLMHEASGGIPRTISVIADNSMVAGFATGARPISSAIVREVCRDLDLERGAARLPSAQPDTAAPGGRTWELTTVTPPPVDTPATEVRGEEPVEMAAQAESRRFKFF